MDSKVKRLAKGEVEIIIEVTSDEFQQYIDAAVNEVSKEVKVSGFRSGKIPFDVLVQHVGKEVIMNHAADIAIPQFLTEVVKKEKLEIIVRPKVEIVSLEPLKFKAVAPVYPEIKVDGYDKIKIKAKEQKITDKDIDETIDRVQKQFVEWNETDKGIKKGDKAELDFEGFDEGGAALEGTDSKNHPLIIGEDMMVPGFEDNLIGLKKGDKTDFTVTFPKDYHKKSFQDKKVKFKVKVLKIENPKYPEIDEDFVEKITGTKKSPADFRKDVKRDLLEYRKSEDRKRQEQDFFDKVIGITKADISDMLVDEEVEHMINEMKADMAQKGLQFDTYLQHIKKEEADLRKEMRLEAEKRIKIRFGVNEIMNKEKITVSESQIDEELKKAGDIPKEKEHEYRGRAANVIRLTQLFDRFLEK